MGWRRKTCVSKNTGDVDRVADDEEGIGEARRMQSSSHGVGDWK